MVFADKKKTWHRRWKHCWLNLTFTLPKRRTFRLLGFRKEERPCSALIKRKTKSTFRKKNDGLMISTTAAESYEWRTIPLVWTTNSSWAREDSPVTRPVHYNLSTNKSFEVLEEPFVWYEEPYCNFANSRNNLFRETCRTLSCDLSSTSCDLPGHLLVTKGHRRWLLL